MQRSYRHRLIPAALALAIGLVTPPLVASPASAAGPYDDKVVLSTGHVDAIDVQVVQGTPTILVHDGTQPGPAVDRAPEDVVLHVRPEAEMAVPPGFGWLGAEGSPVWILPEVQNPALLWPGWATERSPFGYFDTAPVLRMVGADGPGEVEVWVSGSFGGQNRYFSSDETLPSGNAVPMGSHVHANWAFSAPGAYTLTFEVDVVKDGVTTTLGPVDYAWHVGELPADDPGDPVETTLSISGASAHYHAGGVATLTANQDPATGEDHYHWFTRAAGETEWTVVPDALGATYGFIVRTEDDGREVIVRLYDHDHAQIAESAPVTIVVDDHGNSPVEGPVITATLEAEAGSLAISVDAAHQDVELTSLAMNAAGDRYEASGEVGGIRVSDTRSDDPGWTASGRVRSFTTVDGDVLHGNNLGWAPKVLSASDGQDVAAGSAVAPLLSGGSGVGSWRPLGSAPAGAGRGTAVLGADLQLEAPLTLAPGTYRGLLILTVI